MSEVMAYGWACFVIVSEVLACLRNLIPRGRKDARGGARAAMFRGMARRSHAYGSAVVLVSGRVVQALARTWSESDRGECE